MKKIAKTNAARILDYEKIAYTLLEYEVDENDLSAENVAKKCGMPLEQAVKTLVLRGDKTGILVACVPGDTEINLKKLAHLSNNKKVEMVSMKEILPLTGYIRGGVSPLGMKNFKEDASPVADKSIETMKSSAIIYDIVYNPLRTALISKAIKYDKRYVTGLDMLVHQAVRAVEIWCGKKPDFKTMKIAALEEFLINKR